MEDELAAHLHISGIRGGCVRLRATEDGDK